VGGYTAGSGVLTITTQEFNDLELGNQFGPSNIGRHYGTGGTLGGPVQTTLMVNNVVIQPTADDINTAFDESKYGTVTNGGSVLVRYDGSAAGSVGNDYGIPVASVLLQGTVIEALLDANGDNTLDLLVALQTPGGGALQNPNPDLGINFAPANLAVLRITRAAGMPSDWTQSFTLTGAAIDMLGIPEPSAVLLALSASALALLRRSKHFSHHSV
jgi:hypothetical protein